MRTIKCYATLAVLCLMVVASCRRSVGHTEEHKDIPAAMEEVLVRHMLQMWYPRVIDTLNGGYYSTFTYNWEKAANQDKFIVTQARHVWTLAFLYENYEKREEFLHYARHGFNFLKDYMWDAEYGGFFDLTDRTGVLPVGETALAKKAYGNAFALYALAQYYKVCGDSSVLALAKKTFFWLEKHSHDKQNGGYFQLMHRNGSLVETSEAGKFDSYDRRSIGVKDYNSSIHLLEALTALVYVWPDALVKKRLMEMYKIVSGPMLDERGFLKLYFYPDWKAVPDDVIDNYITFGHDVETAFLLYEAAEVLGVEKEELLPKMKRIVDHSLEHGWDQQTGGLYDQGKYVDENMRIVSRHKEWWGQAEALNTFLLMSELFPEEADQYRETYRKQWNYIYTYLIDHTHYGWFPGGIDENPKERKAMKAQIWKGNYHTTRALVSCLNRMKKG